MVDVFNTYWPHVTSAIAILDLMVMAVFLPWILTAKQNSQAAVAWCLVIILLPLVGALMFWMFGYTHISRPLKRVRRLRSAYRAQHPPKRHEARRGSEHVAEAQTWDDLGDVTRRVEGFPISEGNQVQLFHDTSDAFTALIQAAREAKHHIHLEFFIFRSDATTDALIAVLAQKAREGVEVRLIYDAMGCVRLRSRTFRPLTDAGGQAMAFLPLNPLRSRVQVNLRIHRKLVVIDGRTGFTGGMNIGDEYLGKDPYFGYWRDSFLRLDGPAVAGFQRVFVEDWALASGVALDGETYFPPLESVGNAVVQVVESGPDQEVKSIREVYFAAILSARERLWIASPYFVPDSGILDALRLARFRGVDVRLLTVKKPDHWLAYLAARYYYGGMLEVGVKIYGYARGMMHSKLMMVDGKWAMVGSANMDNRSLLLSFELGLALHTHSLVRELEVQFERDLKDSVKIDGKEFARRPFLGRLGENASRLLSPLL